VASRERGRQAIREGGKRYCLLCPTGLLFGYLD
jgi:hypothetical protein